MYLSGASLENIRVALADKRYVNPAEKLPASLHDFLDKPILDPVDAHALPPHRHCDHKIELQPGTTALSDRSIICPSKNSQFCGNISMNNLKRGLFGRLTPQPRPQFSLQRNLVEDSGFALIIELSTLLLSRTDILFHWSKRLLRWPKPNTKQNSTLSLRSITFALRTVKSGLQPSTRDMVYLNR